MKINTSRGRKMIALGAVAVALLASPFAPSTANAAPSPAPSASQSDATVADILRSNPKARQVAPNVVRVAPNVDLVVPANGAANLAADSSSAYCAHQYLCVFEH